jgi:hypothetical protein
MMSTFYEMISIEGLVGRHHGLSKKKKEVCCCCYAVAADISGMK